jgi:hypothetical protein
MLKIQNKNNIMRYTHNSKQLHTKSIVWTGDIGHTAQGLGQRTRHT